MRTFTVDQATPRWVLAVRGEEPLQNRAVGFALTQEELGELGGLEATHEVVEVSGELAVHFPLPGERPLYWESLHKDDEYLGEYAPRLELYRRGDELLVVDDTGPFAPELLGTFPASLRERPTDPDELGIDEDDPLWMEMSETDIQWLQAVEGSHLAQALKSTGAVAGWRLVETLRAVGFDPDKDELTHWLVNRSSELREQNASKQ